MIPFWVPQTMYVILLGTTILKAKNFMNRLAPLKTKALFERGHTHTPRFVLFCFDRSFEFQIPQIPKDYAGLPDTHTHTPPTLLSSSDHGLPPPIWVTPEQKRLTQFPEAHWALSVSGYT